MPHHFSRLVATRRLHLELQLTRQTPQAWLLGEGEHGEALLHIEGHEPLTAFIVAEPRLLQMNGQRIGLLRWRNRLRTSTHKGYRAVPGVAPLSGDRST